jgi:hypothetical protein
LLTTSTIGLPNFFDADNKLHKSKDILDFYRGIEVKGSCLRVSNLRKDFVNQAKEFKLSTLGQYTFVHKGYDYWFHDYPKDNQVKRNLPVTIKKIKMNKTLMLTVFKTSVWAKKGISMKQFEKEIFEEGIDYFAVSGEREESFVRKNLEEKNFVKIANLFWYPLQNNRTSFPYSLYGRVPQ